MSQPVALDFIKGPLEKLILTDFGRLQHVPESEIPEAYRFTSDSIHLMPAYEVMRANINILHSYGAQIPDYYGPFDKVSGFQPSEVERGLGIRWAKDLLSNGQKLDFLIWSSPHHNASNCGPLKHGIVEDNTYFKFNAFQSLLRQTDEVIMMTYPSKYNVWFNSPHHTQELADRELLLCKVYDTNYVPLASSCGYCFKIDPAGRVGFMVAIAYPKSKAHCIIRKMDGNIDLGKTMFAFITNMSANGRAVALGGYIFSLEMEMVQNFLPISSYLDGV